jgi:hypothetical protein
MHGCLSLPLVPRLPELGTQDLNAAEDRHQEGWEKRLQQLLFMTLTGKLIGAHMGRHEHQRYRHKYSGTSIQPDLKISTRLIC